MTLHGKCPTIFWKKRAAFSKKVHAFINAPRFYKRTKLLKRLEALLIALSVFMTVNYW